jgi:hypothetical protein
LVLVHRAKRANVAAAAQAPGALGRMIVVEGIGATDKVIVRRSPECSAARVMQSVRIGKRFLDSGGDAYGLVVLNRSLSADELMRLSTQFMNWVWPQGSAE